MIREKYCVCGVPVSKDDVDRLRAENEKLKEQIKGDTIAHDGLVKMVDEYEAKLKVAVEALEESCICGEFGYIEEKCPACKALAKIRGDDE